MRWKEEGGRWKGLGGLLVGGAWIDGWPSRLFVDILFRLASTF